MINNHNLNNFTEKLKELLSSGKNDEIITAFLNFYVSEQEVNNSESTRKIPDAVKHIRNITIANEMVATEILDTIDLISEKLKLIDDNVKKIEYKESKQSELPKHLNAKRVHSYNPYSDELQEINSLTTAIRQNLNNITLSLQVQDITSQQLSAVHYLINPPDEKNFGIKNQSFDLNASYSRTDGRQGVADEVINEHKIKF